MKKTLFAVLALCFALGAEAQDMRSSVSTIVSSVAGYPDHAASPAAVSTSGTTARTTAIATYTYVRIYCTVETSFKFGASGAVTAATTDPRIAAGVPEMFNTGPNTAIAFILAAGTGSCDVTVMR